MMRRLLFLTITAYLLTAAGRAQGPVKDGIQWNLEHLDKAYGIKFKGAKVDDAEVVDPVNKKKLPVKRIKVTLAFDKELEKRAEILSVFTPPLFTEKVTNPPALWFHLSDEENVLIAKTHISALEGECSGKKGDAFRIVLHVSAKEVLERTKKIEVRPALRPKLEK